MAKENMMCPFSGKLCRNCPIYRGRHYFLCFDEKYRGHITGVDSDIKKNTLAKPENKTKDFIQIPEKMSSAFDPFEIAEND